MPSDSGTLTATPSPTPSTIFARTASAASRAVPGSWWSSPATPNTKLWETITGPRRSSLSTWYQAETGKIPVSGAGYGGPFSGPGFDSMWTDMSEIVRPTRDGIHGREYISTGIDLGRKPMFLIFDEAGRSAFSSPPLLEIPLPVVLAEPSLGSSPLQIRKSLVQAARELNTLALLRRERINGDLGGLSPIWFPATPPAPWTWATRSSPRCGRWKSWTTRVFWSRWIIESSATPTSSSR